VFVEVSEADTSYAPVKTSPEAYDTSGLEIDETPFRVSRYRGKMKTAMTAVRN
jgi:hypothetical protein